MSTVIYSPIGASDIATYVIGTPSSDATVGPTRIILSIGLLAF